MREGAIELSSTTHLIVSPSVSHLTVSPLIAEQVKGTKQSIATLGNGERVIVDPSLTTARLFMYFYFFINVGALVGESEISRPSETRDAL